MRMPGWNRHLRCVDSAQPHDPARCFKCAELTDAPVHGPICGEGGRHAGCHPQPWHPDCREQWLREMDGWARILTRDEGKRRNDRGGRHRA